MRTVRTKVFKFDELDTKAQDKVIDRMSDINTDYGYWDRTYESFETLCAFFGVSINRDQPNNPNAKGRIQMYFSGFYHQGQGSAFNAYVDVCKFVEAVKGETWKQEFPKVNLSFYKVTPNIERVCKLIAAGKVDGDCAIECANRETSVKLHFDYSPWSTSNLSYDFTRVKSAIDDLRDLLDDGVNELNSTLFKWLRDEYEYLSSREAIIETIKANEYEFLKDGSIYHNNN